MTAVSIIMPAYNAARYIEEAIASALMQTLADLELIVVDDASTDNTAAIAERFATTDARVRVLRQAENAGPSAARNRGLGEARGRWIAILDADDAFLPDRLAPLVALGETQALDMVADNLLLVPDEDPGAARAMIPAGLLPEPRALPLAEFVRRNIADARYPGCNFGFLKPLFRADFLREHGLRYDERVRFAEDFTLYVACLRRGARWWLMPQATYRYRVRGDSLTQVQTVHDLSRLREVQAALLADAGDDRAFAATVRRHQRVVDRCYYYRSFTDDVKAKRVAPALRTLIFSPRSAALIAEESLRQLPVIAAKALRGGYWR